MKKLSSLLLGLFVLSAISVPQVYAGGQLVSFEISPSQGSINPGEQYIVRPFVLADSTSGNPCKNCAITLKFSDSQNGDYIAQSSDKTDEKGTMYAKVISKVAGTRYVYADVTIANGSNWISDKIALNYASSQTKGTSIGWATNYASLQADDFYIVINGRTLGITANGASITSSPTSFYENVYHTTLESTWFEEGVEMRMNLYFTYKPGGFWKLSEVRTYDGEKNGEWIYYKPTDQFGQAIQHSIGETYKKAGVLELKSTSGTGFIHFENVMISAFGDMPTHGVTISPKQTATTPGGSNGQTEQLNKKVAELEGKLQKSEEKQNALEATVQNLMNFIRSLFPFFKG